MNRHFALPVPRQWSKHIKSAFIHTISLASTVFTSTQALGSKRKATVTRLKAELAQAYQEIALLKEEMQIKDDRFRRLSSHRRPYYRPIQRLRILELKAAQRWSISQTAKAFLLNEQTVVSWMRRIDEEGECLDPARRITVRVYPHWRYTSRKWGFFTNKEPSPHSTVYCHGRCTHREA